MDKQFTASEVRNEASNHWRLSDGPQQTLAGKMLHAFADRLEADEQAVPSAWMVSDDGWNQCFTTLEQCQMYGKKLIPLYTHPAPADAERLAEALRELLGDIDLVKCDFCKCHTWCSVEDSRKSLIKHEAHSAQAQPPAASVTDAMVERACKKYAFREDGAAFPDAYSDEEVLAERTLMREFLEHVLLAAQENPNG